MERQADREEAVRHYLEERLGGAEVRVVVGHPSLEIAFCVEADGEHPSHRPLQLSFEVIADHGARQLAEFVDSWNVIEGTRAAGSKPVVVFEGSRVSVARPAGSCRGRVCTPAPVAPGPTKVTRFDPPPIRVLDPRTAIG